MAGRRTDFLLVPWVVDPGLHPKAGSTGGDEGVYRVPPVCAPERKGIRRAGGRRLQMRFDGKDGRLGAHEHRLMRVVVVGLHDDDQMGSYGPRP